MDAIVAAKVDSTRLIVNEPIAEVSKQAHQLMGQCLDEILDLEGRDKNKLEMPTGIRARIEKLMRRDHIACKRSHDFKVWYFQ